ncbi:MAG: type III pantothenate kinase [Sphingobacteriaceae bacterium]|nr:type III pantothenate kinase [Sphingobacteriaceae bacterium]
MFHLVIDIGNSSQKLAVFEQHNLVHTELTTSLNTQKLAQLLAQYPCSHSIISSVKQEVTSLEKYLAAQTTHIRFTADTPNPIHNQYQSPETLGLDRLAVMVAVSALFPKQNTLVIDAGTCITYDMLDAQANYFGGSISPGIQMRFRALHEFTNRLPLVSFSLEFIDLVGIDTPTAMQSGVINGLIAEVNCIITQYQHKHAQLNVVFCGGDANFFDSRLKNSIFASNSSCIPHLVLIGLNEIIHHQYA